MLPTNGPGFDYRKRDTGRYKIDKDRQTDKMKLVCGLTNKH